MLGLGFEKETEEGDEEEKEEGDEEEKEKEGVVVEIVRREKCGGEERICGDGKKRVPKLIVLDFFCCGFCGGGGGGDMLGVGEV